VIRDENGNIKDLKEEEKDQEQCQGEGGDVEEMMQDN